MMCNRARFQPRRSALAFAMAVGLGLVSSAALAQSTVGTIYGNASAGSTIQADSTSSGLSRSATADADGKFNIGSLPPGQYKVTMQGPNGTSTRMVTVVAGQGYNLNVAPGVTNAQELGTVQVTASSIPAIDVSSVETTTVFTAEQLKTLPVARNQTAVALLAPGTVEADSTFGNLAVFNGASAAENSYYVNGFNVTNQFQTLTYSEVPFEGIDQEEVKSGGYGAQYGFSTGGVISVITKRGTNQWKGGANVYWTPKSLRGHDPSVYNNDGNLSANNDKDKSSATTYSAWIGGPLVKDKLFVYGLFQKTKTDQDTYGGFNGGTGADYLVPRGYLHDSYKDPFWLVKLDWNINDSNILEYTGFSDRQTQTEASYLGTYNDDLEPVAGDYAGVQTFKSGGNVNILKYTGYLTDALTLSAQYGKLKYSRDNYGMSAAGIPESYNGVVGDFNQPGCAVVRDSRDPVLAQQIAPITGCDWSTSYDKRGGGDEKKSGRIDLEWRVGDHDLKFGYSNDKWNSDTGSSGYEGGAYWRYYTRLDPATGETVAGATGAPSDSYVRLVLFQTGAQVEIDQQAFYLEDYWNVTDRFLAYVGLRDDNFENKNGSGATYVKQDNILQPRLGFSWDVNGDSSLKVYGSAGDYSLPIAANVALRAASASLYEIQTFNYTGVDPVTGVPTGLTTPAPGTTAYDNPYFANGENGSVPDPSAVASKDLKPYKQREFILGFDQQLADNWTFGVKAMYRKLLNAIDDNCDWRPFQRYGQDVLGMTDVPDYPPSNVPGCYLFNPGSGMDMNIDLNGDGTPEHVKLSAADIGEPEAKRSFGSVELSLEHQFNDKWYMRASYVWSRSFGNTEGLVNSTIDQTDTGTTEDFDYPEFAAGSNGVLPNDRTHTLKVFGAYQLTDEWTVGGNLLAQTGRPISCIGITPDDNTYNYIGYGDGAAFYYCNGQLSPRGTAGRTPVLWNLDLNVDYKPSWAKGLTLAVDVHNVFNKHTVTEVNEAAEDAFGTYYDYNYRQPTNWQQPRYVRLMAQYDFSL